jgi:hypothetical protein
MQSRFDRQSFLGSDSEATLASAAVGIVGLGGGGSHIVQQLAHLGIGYFRLYDPDRIDDEGTNLNRLIGATEEDVRSRTEKTSIAARLIRGINGAADVKLRAEHWQSNPDLLLECDVIFGCVDSFADRRELEAFARRLVTPYIDIGMDVHKVEGHYAIAGQVALSIPGSPCMNCYGLIRSDEDRPRYGAAGHRPQVVWPNGVLASTAVGLFVQLLTPWTATMRRSVVIEYDGNTHTMKLGHRVDFLRGKVCPHFPGDQVGNAFQR